jgi:hypothetical protein
MADEINWQKKYIDAIRQKGCYGKKWASTWSVGVPDLVTSITGLGLVTMEAKLEKAWTKNTFRTLGLTPKQVEELAGIRAADGLAFVLLFVQQAQRETYLNLFVPPPHEPNAELRIDKHTALEGSFRWEDKAKSSIVDWTRDKIKELS